MGPSDRFLTGLMVKAIPCFHEPGSHWDWRASNGGRVLSLWAYLRGSGATDLPWYYRVSGKCRPKPSVNLGGPTLPWPLGRQNMSQNPLPLHSSSLRKHSGYLPSPTGLTSDFRGAQGGRLYSWYPNEKGPRYTLSLERAVSGKPEVTISICDYNSKRTLGFHGH